MVASVEGFGESMSLDELIHEDRTSSAMIRKFEIYKRGNKARPGLAKREMP